MNHKNWQLSISRKLKTNTLLLGMRELKKAEQYATGMGLVSYFWNKRI